jgi:hypothetical protein
MSAITSSIDIYVALTTNNSVLLIMKGYGYGLTIGKNRHADTIP